MKNCMATIFAVFVVMFLVLTQCRSVQSDAKLIEKTCKRTLHYDLCMATLKADPRSYTADERGLALIMVDKVKRRTRRSLVVSKKLIVKRPELEKPLSYCGRCYAAIFKRDIPVAIEALQKNNPKFAEEAMNEAANFADWCEDNFQGNSPLTKLNRLLSDTARVASAIIKILL